MYQLYANMINDWNQYVRSENLFTDFDLNGPYSDVRFLGCFNRLQIPAARSMTPC